MAVTFGMISMACSSYFKRTAASLVVSYLLILPLALDPDPELSGAIRAALGEDAAEEVRDREAHRDQVHHVAEAEDRRGDRLAEEPHRARDERAEAGGQDLQAHPGDAEVPLDLALAGEFLEMAAALVGGRDKVKVLIGGAPVTQAFADEIGADGFAPDASSATRTAKALLA